MGGRVMFEVTQPYHASGTVVAYQPGHRFEPGSVPEGVPVREVAVDDAAVGRQYPSAEEQVATYQEWVRQGKAPAAVAFAPAAAAAAPAKAAAKAELAAPAAAPKPSAASKPKG